MIFKNIISPKYIIQNYPVLMELIDGSEFDLTLDVLDLFILWMIYEKSNTMKSPFKAYIRSFKKESSIPFSVDQNGKIILVVLSSEEIYTFLCYQPVQPTGKNNRSYRGKF